MSRSALVAQIDGYVVFVVENGVARRREVKIAKREAGAVQVLDGLAPGEQVVTAGQMRPILMTTGATVLGARPLAFASGAGSESRSQIGWLIVGGMTFGTLLTLYVVPVAYSFFLRTSSNPGEEAAGLQAYPDE